MDERRTIPSLSSLPSERSRIQRRPDRPRRDGPWSPAYSGDAALRNSSLRLAEISRFEGAGQPGRGAFLQQTGHGGTVNQRRQAGGEDHTVELLSRLAGSNEVRLWLSVIAYNLGNPARRDDGWCCRRELATGRSPACSTGWPRTAGCALLLAVIGRGAPESGAARQHAEDDRGAAVAQRLADHCRGTPWRAPTTRSHAVGTIVGSEAGWGGKQSRQVTGNGQTEARCPAQEALAI